MINNEDQNQQQSQEIEIELLQRQGGSQEMMNFVANDITHPSSDRGRRRGAENNNFSSSNELDEGEDADSLSNEEREDLSNTYLERR